MRKRTRAVSPHGRSDDESGAILPIVALMMVVLLGMSSFAVDLGMQRVARRDMQAVADGVALDLARLVDGRTATQIIAGGSGKSSLAAAREASVARNDSTHIGAPATVTAILITRDVNGDPVRDGSGAVVSLTGAQVPDAVYVTATTSVNFAFAGVFDGPSSGSAARTAIGASQSNACFRLGSFAAAISANSALTPTLNKYLNNALGLSVVGYEGLSNASITLGGLAAQLGAGSVDALANLKNVTLKDLFSASATVLSSEGGEAADVTLLRQLSTSVMTSLTVDMSQVIDLTSGGSSALSTSFNVLDLVAGAGFVANGTNLLTLSTLWNFPQFSSGATSLQIIEGPQGGCGTVNRARASTAQIKMTATPNLNIPTIAGLSNPEGKVPVSFVADLASATGTLTAVTCGAGTAVSPESFSVAIARSLSTLKLTISIHLTGDISASTIVKSPLPWGLSSLLNGSKATVDLTVDAGASVTLGAASTTGVYAVPPHNYTDAEHVGGSTGISLPGVTITNAEFSGTIALKNLLGVAVVKNLTSLNLSSDVTLQPIIDDLVQKNVVPGINDFISNINNVINPLTQLFGIQTAGVDLFGLPRPSCNDPVLRG
jgi:uncharacterized membrane protein